uniref:DUF834 domain-containing protein n=1 Tax=Oryza nivara TaxID=4536 RepID=A0A0E0HS06_ORYNI
MKGSGWVGLEEVAPRCKRAVAQRAAWALSAEAMRLQIWGFGVAVVAGFRENGGGGRWALVRSEIGSQRDKELGAANTDALVHSQAVGTGLTDKTIPDAGGGGIGGGALPAYSGRGRSVLSPVVWEREDRERRGRRG